MLTTVKMGTMMTIYKEGADNNDNDNTENYEIIMTSYIVRYHYKDGEGGGRDTYLADNNITTYLIEGRVEVIMILTMMTKMVISMMLKKT